MQRLYDAFRALAPRQQYFGWGNAEFHWLCEAYFFCEFIDSLYTFSNTFQSLCSTSGLGPILSQAWQHRDMPCFNDYQKRYRLVMQAKLGYVQFYKAKRTQLMRCYAAVCSTWRRCTGFLRYFYALQLAYQLLAGFCALAVFFYAYYRLYAEGVSFNLVRALDSCELVDCEEIAQCVTYQYAQVIHSSFTQSVLLS